MKENKKRILFWFIVMVVFLIMGITGKKFFNSGSGKYGKVKQILEPLAVNFNTSENVKKLTDLRANVKQDYLVVTYINPNGKKENYKYEYTNSNGIETIKNKDEYGNNMWLFIAQQMADAVYQANGGSGSIFALYDYNIFSETSINDGLVINNNSKEITINIKQNIVRNINGKYESLKDNIYAKETDLTNMTSELSSNKSFRYNYQDINVYVKDNNNSYDIYASITENNKDRVYLSIANIINILKPNVYSKLNINNNIVTFEEQNDNYITQNNVVFSESGIFNTDDIIFRLILKK